MSDFPPFNDSSRDPDRRSIARIIIRLFVFVGLISVLLTVFARPLPVVVLGSGAGEFIGAVVIFLLIPLLIVSTLRSSNRFQSRRQEREEARQRLRESMREFRDDLRDLRDRRAIRQAGTMSEPEKHKNAAPGMDMYSLMDRMVDELDDEEIAYLQQKLQDRSSGEDVDLPQSIGDLLDKRTNHRLGE